MICLFFGRGTPSTLAKLVRWNQSNQFPFLGGWEKARSVIFCRVQKKNIMEIQGYPPQ